MSCNLLGRRRNECRWARRLTVGSRLYGIVHGVLVTGAEVRALIVRRGERVEVLVLTERGVRNVARARQGVANIVAAERISTRLTGRQKNRTAAKAKRRVVSTGSGTV
jgi:hypothetical protein